MNNVSRRQILLTAGALLIAPFGVRAQARTKPYRIGFLTTAPDEKLLESLRDLGYVEGRDKASVAPDG